MDPKDRFSGRAQVYSQYRPSYPTEVLDILSKHTGFGSGTRVADIGSGTGKFSELLLSAHAEVFAVEPNQEMRELAEIQFGKVAGFHSINGSAEETTLPGSSADLITVAQAFHWFDIPLAQKEFQRILVPNGWVALIWNVRRPESDPFGKAYDELMSSISCQSSGPGQSSKTHSRLEQFYDSDGFESYEIPNPQFLFWEELVGRAKSASYFPNESDPIHDQAIEELKTIFHQHKSGGRVNFNMSTELYIGQVKLEPCTPLESATH